MKTMPLLMLLATGSALADDAALLRCRAVADISSRVACYDAIPVSAAAAPAAAARAAYAAPAAAQAAPLAAAPAPAPAPAATAQATVATSPAGAPVATAAAAPSWTALPARPSEKAEAAKQADTVETSIEGAFMGWVPNQRIRLANGQIWRIEDGSSEDTDLKSPKATLRRGMLGAVYLDIEGAYRAPRVRRVQ